MEVDLIIKNTKCVGLNEFKEFKTPVSKSIIINNGEIIDINDNLSSVYISKKTIDGSNTVTFPGFINSHTHVSPTPILKGFTEDKVDGFYGLALPMEKQLNEKNTYLTAKLGIAEAVKGGYTTINDIWHYPWSIAQAAKDIGIRAVLSNKLKDTDLSKIQFFKYERDDYEGQTKLKDSENFISKWHNTNNGLITCRVGIHAPDTLSNKLIKQAKEMADNLQLGIHMHMGQTATENKYMNTEYNMGSVEYLNSFNFFDNISVIGAHCNFVTDKEKDILSENDFTVAHCPVIGAKRSHYANIPSYEKKGVKIGLGTDWLTFDAFENIRASIYFHRLSTNNVESTNAIDAVKKSTIIPAESLGLKNSIGSIDIGKKADLNIISTDDLHFGGITKYHDLLSLVIYNATAKDIKYSIIQGKIISEDNKINTISESETLKDAELEISKIWTNHFNGTK